MVPVDNAACARALSVLLEFPEKVAQASAENTAAAKLPSSPANKTTESAAGADLYQPLDGGPTRPALLCPEACGT